MSFEYYKIIHFPGKKNLWKCQKVQDKKKNHPGEVTSLIMEYFRLALGNV